MIAPKACKICRNMPIVNGKAGDSQFTIECPAKCRPVVIGRSRENAVYEWNEEQRG
jgi:hypothetical protein